MFHKIQDVIRDMKLTRKVISFVILILLAFLFIVQQYWLGQSLLDKAELEDQRIRGIGELIQRVGVTVFEARQLEKDFLLLNDIKYADQHADVVGQIMKSVGRLVYQFDQPAQQGLIRSLKASLDGYQANFKEVVSQGVKVGLTEDSGLISELRLAVVAAGRVLRGGEDKSLLWRMELMRGAERDFLKNFDTKYYRRLEVNMELFLRAVAGSQLPEEKKERISDRVGVYYKSFLGVHDGVSKSREAAEKFQEAAQALTPILGKLKAQGEQMLVANKAAVAEARSAVELRFLSILIAVAVVTCFLVWFAALYIVRGVSKAAEVGENVAQGDLSNVIESTSNDEIGLLLKTLDRMQIQLRERIERDGRIANEALRIQTALDNVSTSVLVVDKHYRVIYQNKSAQLLFERTEDGIREDLPGFSAANLVGSSIDDFHENPDYQREILDGLTGTHKARIHLGGYVLDLAVNAVINSDGDRIGTALELDDVTEQVEVEQEIDGVVSSVSEGDFERQIDLIGKEGFFNSLGSGVNELIYAVSESIDEVENVLSGLADGNLSRRVSGGMQGAFGRLAGNTNQTIVRLFEIVTNIREAATLIASSSSEISSGNENMSQRTEAQAANLEETAATMEEFTASIKQNADSAQQANQLAVNAQESAQKGGSVVGEAIVAMEEITAASDQIASIIGVIDDIAFQTNLLALNASVEAARAGEQGRGFAVVATEVRNLAGRSAQAAKEIKGLIASSSDKVKSGTQLVNQSGNNLKKTMLAVQKVNDIIYEIATASREQAMGVEQVNRAITDMDAATQQNAALAEQTSAVSCSLSAQAKHLEEMVGFFNVEGDSKVGPG
ncbi:MAG: HAMP domain-containing protein [Gammaproteobacteria bacterium]|nr:HAMP domain-containing protein [Gammaproteobacteria bacterium]